MEPSRLPEPLKRLQAYNLGQSQDYCDLVALLAKAADLSMPAVNEKEVLADLLRVEVECSPLNIFDNQSAHLKGADSTPKEYEPDTKAGSYAIRSRKDFWDEILEHISRAEKSVLFVGGISSTLLTVDKLTVFAKALEKNPELHMEFIFESDDNLFRRSQYLTRPLIPEDFRDFKGMKRRKQDIIDLPRSIPKYADASRMESVSKRISVKEIHLQLYLIVTMIDHIFYMTPISHRRNSRSVTIRVEDPANQLYQLLKQYVDYLAYEKCGKPYLGAPHEEILQILDPSGIPRGYCARSTMDRVNLHAKVVFGFLFDRDGRLLLQRRSDHAYDNAGLWDKSFGGHMKAFQDTSIIDTLKRELNEELLCACNKNHWIKGVIKQRGLNNHGSFRFWLSGKHFFQ